MDRRREPGHFLLTGSADVLLLPSIADFLAGRMEVLSLWPLSAADLVDAPDINRAGALSSGDGSALQVLPCEKAALTARLVSGDFSEAAARTMQPRREAWFNSYMQAILQWDVRELANIEQLTEIPDLLQLLATRSGSLLNLAELWRTARLPQTTLKRYSSRCWRCCSWWYA